MKIDIIMPCFNQLSFTQETVDCINRESKSHNYRFIFINNGSTDGTLMYLNSIKDAVVINNLTNMYVNHAWNQGLQEVRADYVCIINNDVIVGTGWLEEVQHAFYTRENEWYVPMANYLTYWVRFGKYRTYQQFKEYVSDAEPFQLGEMIPGFCMFFRTQDIKKVTPIPEILKIWYGDVYMYKKLTNLGIHLHLLPKCKVYHHGSKTIDTSDSFQKIIDVDCDNWFILNRVKFI